jgi:hypothetical protein
MERNITTYLPLALALCLPLFACTLDREPTTMLSAPAGDQYITIDPEGRTIIPNGRFIEPLGRTIEVAPHPFGLTLSPDGSIAVTANSGVAPLSITIIRDILSDTPDVRQVPPGPATDKGVLASVFMGLSLLSDGDVVAVSAGQENKIYFFDTKTGGKIDSVDCSVDDQGGMYPDGYIGDMVLSSDEQPVTRQSLCLCRECRHVRV